MLNKLLLYLGDYANLNGQFSSMKTELQSKLLQEVSRSIRTGYQEVMEESENPGLESVGLIHPRNTRAETGIDWKNLGHFVKTAKSDKFIARKGRVILKIKGTNSAYFIDRLEPEAVVSSHFFIIETDPDYLNPAYLCAFLNSDAGQSLLENAQTGNVIPHLRKSALQKVSIPLPRLEHQARIAEILERFSMQARLRVRESEIRKDLYSIVINRAFAALSKSPEVDPGNREWEKVQRNYSKFARILAENEIALTHLMNGITGDGPD